MVLLNQRYVNSHKFRSQLRGTEHRKSTPSGHHPREESKCLLLRSWEIVCSQKAGHQHLPTFEINDYTGIFVQCRSMVLSIIDIMAHVDYISSHRHLYFAFGLRGKTYHIEVTIN